MDTDERPVYRRPVQFRVLGPLEVDAGDGPIPLGGPKQRAVLASLLIRPNQVVPAESLIEDVWGHEAPDTARNILQTYIANLRKTLGDGRLQGRPPGYVLAVEPSELDATRFDALVADAKKTLPVDPSVAITTFEDALGLWRGPALADLNEHASLLAEAARLDELRLDAQEDRIEGLLSTGSQAKALAELEPLLARHPLRESLWGLAMLAYYRDGRQADALNAFGRARELLADELGIDPSRELARVHERILKQDPSLDLRGEPLRGYRLLERIGAGPSGAVFRGIQPHVGRDVAVKVFDERIAADPDFVARFERDAQILAALEHPHIVPTHDYWREPGRAYLVTRYMRGGSLRALQERGDTLDRERTLRIVSEVASALEFAHRQGVAHGGIGPSNVLLDAEGNAYLGDFKIGVGTAADPSEDLRALTRWARDLLANDVPPSLAGILVDDGSTATSDPDAVAKAAREALASTGPVSIRAPEERNPYKGLRAFTEADAADFYGRTELTHRLLARLNEPGPAARFLAVVGPSGGGKSSAIRAGLIPALRGGELATSNRVFVADLFPGTHPLDEFEAALVRVAARPQPRLADLLRGGTRGLLEAVERVLPEDAELVLVIDQFEELFTLTTDEQEREHVLESLRVACVDPSSRLRVIATLRADFYDRPLIYPRFGELLADRNETVPPLTADELEQAIRRPAERQGVVLEPGLVAEMIADVAHQPGGLPLLQYALTELFERRDGDRLTLPAYRDIGGVAGALSARADRLYAAADDDGRRAIEQVFLRLVTLGEGRQDTRRRVELAELDVLDVSDLSVGDALDSYGRHRLLTFDREPSTREPTVEIAHEALLRAWQRLGSWIDRAREDLRQNDRLSRASAEWRASDEDPSFLMSGARLEQVEAWATATALSIGQPERGYLKASLDQRDRTRLAEEARRNREAQVERRSVRRLRALVVVFAVAALAAGSLTIVATNESGRAEREATISRARELASAAIANIEFDPELSILLAMRAVDTTRLIDGSVLPQASDALHKAVVASRVTSTIPGLTGAVAAGPDGLLATESSEQPGTVDLRNASSGEIIRSIDAHEGQVIDMAFNPAGDLLATSGRDGSLWFWAASDGAPVGGLTGQGEADGISFDADGSLIAAAWPEEGVLRVVETSTGRVVATIEMRTGSTSLNPQGDQVAIVRGKQIHVVDVQTGLHLYPPMMGSAPTDVHYDVHAVAWSPDGSTIASSNVAALDLWESTTGTLRMSVPLASGELAWSPDSTRLAFGVGGSVKVWQVGAEGDAGGMLTVSSSEMTSGISGNGLTFSADGSEVIATGYGPGSALKAWDVRLEGAEEIRNLRAPSFFGDVEFTPDGRRFLAVGPSGRVGIWDLQSHGPLGLVGAPVKEQFFDVTADGDTLAEVNYGGTTVTAWDVATGTRLFRYTTPADANGVAWSPDGERLVVTTQRSLGAPVLDRSGSVIFVIGPGLYMDQAAFSPDGSTIATAGGPSGGVAIWDATTGAMIHSFPAHGWSLEFDPSGSRIVTSGRWGTPEVWDVRTGRLLGLLESSEGEVCDVAFSPDGSSIAAGGKYDTTRVFDAETWEQTLVLRGSDADAHCVRSVDFSPDGTMLGTQTVGTVRIWALDIDTLLGIARRNLTRPLFDAECSQYLHVGTCPA